MTGPEGLIELSLEEFARATAAQGPVPGSGSVAAALGALGAGLASMALGSARGEPAAAAMAAEEARAMEALLARVELDAQAYAAYLEARAGRGDLAEAVARSIALPREIAEHALAALEGLVAGIALVRPRLHSEGLTASRALLAAVEGAGFTARSNLAGLADAAKRERARAELQALAVRARVLVAELDRALDPALDSPSSR